MLEHDSLNPSRDISITNLPKGIFYISVFCKNELILNEKLVIINGENRIKFTPLQF